jgi:hypothetical protein
MPALPAKSIQMPVRVRALLERFIGARLHGDVTLVFSDGAIVDVKIGQRLRAKDLPPPVLIEPDQPLDDPPSE